MVTNDQIWVCILFSPRPHGAYLKMLEKMFSWSKTLKQYFLNLTITCRALQVLSELTTGHPPLRQAPTSGLPAISANCRGIIKEEPRSGTPRDVPFNWWFRSAHKTSFKLLHPQFLSIQE